MSILVCRQAEVHRHWSDALAALRPVLPNTGQHYVLRPSYPDVELAIGNAERETTTRYDGRRISLVPFLEVPHGRNPVYWLAWHEAWRSAKTGRDQWEFRSSSIAIYFGEVGSNKRQVLRAEWAGAEVLGRGKDAKLVFQGNGAAHPHWHLAGIETPTDMPGADRAEVSVSETKGSLAMFADEIEDGQVTDLTAILAGEPSAPSNEIDTAWARIHLATSARWAQMEWLGPDASNDTHAINPASCGEIRSWLVSCVRYLQSEIQGQIGRGRW